MTSAFWLFGSPGICDLRVARLAVGSIRISGSFKPGSEIMAASRLSIAIRNDSEPTSPSITTRAGASLPNPNLSSSVWKACLAGSSSGSTAMPLVPFSSSRKKYARINKNAVAANMLINGFFITAIVIVFQNPL